MLRQIGILFARIAAAVIGAAVFVWAPGMRAETPTKGDTFDITFIIEGELEEKGGLVTLVFRPGGASETGETEVDIHLAARSNLVIVDLPSGAEQVYRFRTKAKSGSTQTGLRSAAIHKQRASPMPRFLSIMSMPNPAGRLRTVAAYPRSSIYMTGLPMPVWNTQICKSATPLARWMMQRCATWTDDAAARSTVPEDSSQRGSKVGPLCRHPGRAGGK